MTYQPTYSTYGADNVPLLSSKRERKLPNFSPHLPTRILHRPSFILHSDANETDCTVFHNYRCLRSNSIQGGKRYVNGEITHRERNVGTYQTERQRNGNYLQFYTATMPQGYYPLFHDWEKGASQLRRIVGLFAYKRKQRMSVNVESIIAAEAKRISAEYGKSFLDCDDIVALTGLGRDNVRTLMKSRSFPVVQVGKRQVVSIIAFVTWQMSAYCEGVDGNGKH